MDDLDKFIRDAEETVNQVRRAVAEYEASADSLDRLRRETTREIERFESLRGNDKVNLDDAVDLFVGASELKLAAFEEIGELAEAYDDLIGFEDDDLTNVHNYPIEIQFKFYAMSDEEQQAIVEETRKMAEEAAKEGDKTTAPKGKPKRKRMSV